MRKKLKSKKEQMMMKRKQMRQMMLDKKMGMPHGKETMMVKGY